MGEAFNRQRIRTTSAHRGTAAERHRERQRSSGRGCARLRAEASELRATRLQRFGYSSAVVQPCVAPRVWADHWHGRWAHLVATPGRTQGEHLLHDDDKAHIQVASPSRPTSQVPSAQKCISRESNPGHIDGNDVFYH